MLDGSGGIDQDAIEIEDDGLAGNVCPSFTSFSRAAVSIHVPHGKRFGSQDLRLHISVLSPVRAGLSRKCCFVRLLLMDSCVHGHSDRGWGAEYQDGQLAGTRGTPN